MKTARILIVFSLIAFAAGCSSDTAAPPQPTPVPQPAPQPQPQPQPSPGSTVSIVGGASTLTTTAFNPNPITVARGTTVQWTNNDAITHTSTADGAAWNSGNIGPGGSFSATFQTAGTFTYHCAIHPNMVASVVVQ